MLASKNIVRICECANVLAVGSTSSARGFADKKRNKDPNDGKEDDSYLARGVEQNAPNMPDGISDAAQKVADATKKKFHDTQSIGEKIADKAGEAADAVKSKLRAAKETVSEKAHDVKEKITGDK